ncbi:MAG: hypothetical protein ACRDRX_04390 [Pseudonocardiaceae bacterium]
MLSSRLARACAKSAALVGAALLLAASPSAEATPYTYDQFSRMTQRSAGQYWQGGSAAGQWAWSPNVNGSSDISWGDPTPWPPAGYEHFTRDSQWVYLEGYGDRTTGEFLPQVVTSESIGDVNCQTMTPLPNAGGRQHYTKWTISPTAYCVDAVGYLDYHGTRIDYRHQQVWFPPSGPTCTNTYYVNQRCLKQFERYWDNNGNPGGPLVLRHWRDHILAKDLGMAFIVHDYATNWEAHGRYYWTY